MATRGGKEWRGDEKWLRAEQCLSGKRMHGVFFSLVLQALDLGPRKKVHSLINSP